MVNPKLNKRNSFALIVCVIALLSSLTVVGQTIESKSCGNCQMPVSVNSRVGQRCPHCGVVWGRENSSTSYKNIDSSSGISSYGITKARCNVRFGPSRNYQVIDKLDAFQSVDIIDYSGLWYEIEYYDYSGYFNSGKKRGWVHSSLIN